ncbi:hypothetical protein AJ80_02972 [Polytolypa hystricis UAMH7299]|uniref:Uncharacterized protein n=1 Tax=Polytolypa hystricis (strain UAMH7299) TaxID=1447883 RepID=A0A2B7YPL0_POLH7|nr:hypothetical protein AJ80_02972 [Polytolypa hystricis UAMH7299]
MPNHNRVQRDASDGARISSAHISAKSLPSPRRPANRGVTRSFWFPGPNRLAKAIRRDTGNIPAQWWAHVQYSMIAVTVAVAVSRLPSSLSAVVNRNLSAGAL